MSTVTVTGVVGPAQAVTALVLTNVKSFSFEENQTLRVVDANNHVKTFEISTAVTITLTVSGGVYTLEVADA